MSQREYFDIVMIIPLEEELIAVLDAFDCTEDRTNRSALRYVIADGVSTLKILVIQQNDMGRTNAAVAAAAALNEFHVGLIISLGIAGGLSGDLHLGDVCYSGGIIDVLDNIKTVDAAHGAIDQAFSPTHYSTDTEITVALNLIRVMPGLRKIYMQWQIDREAHANALLPIAIVGRGGIKETIGKPATKNGAIACGTVSKSDQYNEKLFDIDRKILAIDTESGGIFSEARRAQTSALTIRGISDYADGSKNSLEVDTGGKIRLIAASNAASFLKLQLQNPHFVKIIEEKRLQTQIDKTKTSGSASCIQPLMSIITNLGELIDQRLGELSPEFRLRDKGYRLPLPRIRHLNFNHTIGEQVKSNPVEVRDALETYQHIFVHIPRGYPDASMPWVLANDLLTAEVGGCQAIPVVIDGGAIRPPKFGLSALSAKETVPLADKAEGICKIFILDDVPLSSKTRLSFLSEEVKKHEAAKFVFLTRADPNLIRESEFCTTIGAAIFEVGPISFAAITHFVQKNFNMTSIEAEVIALRLRKTFEQFDLPAHPTYFAGLLRETLSALLQANRRAELIQLAVDGFLSFVVADDRSDVTLSRTTRSKFLRRLAVELKVEGKSLNQEGVIALTAQFAKQYDFDISPITFINSFLERGIIRFVHGDVQFSLPFIESYLLALELSGNLSLAMRYFDFRKADFDVAAFDLYAEIGPDVHIIDALCDKLSQSCEWLDLGNDTIHILLSDEINPALLSKPERLQNVQQRLRKAIDDVNQNKGDLRKKQQMLDIYERAREEATKRSKKAPINDKESTDNHNLRVQQLDEGMLSWIVGIILLGAGSEHLEADKKRELSSLVVKLSARIIHHWTMIYHHVDFDKLRDILLSPESIREFSEATDKEVSVEDTRRLVRRLIEVVEFSYLAEPFRRVIHYLCEQARHRVLATSVENAEVVGVMESILHAAWLSDIESKRGSAKLKEAIRSCPRAAFLRINLASHFITRVYWSHWKKEDRLALLDAAEEAIVPLHVNLDRGQLQRIIEQELK